MQVTDPKLLHFYTRLGTAIIEDSVASSGVISKRRLRCPSGPDNMVWHTKAATKATLISMSPVKFADRWPGGGVPPSAAVL